MAIKPLILVGLGDPHLDGKLSKDIPNLNEVIIDEMRIAIKDGVSKGATVVVIYGDVCETSVMSSEAYGLLFDLIASFPDLMFIVIRGNHDTDSDTDSNECSLHLLKKVEELGMLSNLKVILSTPTTLFKSRGTPIRFLPWPHTNTKPDLLNIMHSEVYGAKQDNGRDYKGHEDVANDHLTVSGHLHTAQKVRNTHFSGTLYQTTFGERPEKFYHLIRWTGDVKTSRVTLVPHAPKYVLRNAVVNSQEDYEALVTEIREAGDYVLWKVFVNSKEVILPVNAFDKLHTVIKTNPFSTKEELQALVVEELEIREVDSGKIDLDAALGDWMLQNQIDEEMQKRAARKLADLIGRGNSDGSKKARSTT